LIENPDVIQNVANMPQRPAQVVAFAAESENHIEHAKLKLVQKQVDMIVANDVCGMGGNDIEAWVISKHGERKITRMDKQKFATCLVDLIR